MKVLCISGHAGSGKGTFVEMLQEELEARGNTVLIINYGDFVKLVALRAFHWDGCKQGKGRELLQRIGTDIGRSLNPDMWVNCVLDIIVNLQSVLDYVLIADVRFPNEIENLKTAGLDVKHLRMLRSSEFSQLSEEQREHASEVSLEYEMADYYIKNEGTLDDLQAKVINFVNDFKWIGGNCDEIYDS